jgi:sugar fermentation stimulation protein A
MDFKTPLVEGTLIRRYKRFLADVRLDDGREVTAHCPNPGSMRTCAEPGWRVLLSPSSNPKRKLKWTWEIVLADGVPVLVNTARPNAVVAEAIEAGSIPELRGYQTLRREVRYGENSRIDILLEGASDSRPSCFVEVKSATLSAGDRRVIFPDSVTKRGTKHMRELAREVQAGHRAVVFFLVSRGDAEVFSPADEIDPVYGKALRDAVAAGVEVLAYRCEITKKSLSLGPPVRVSLSSA